MKINISRPQLNMIGMIAAFLLMGMFITACDIAYNFEDKVADGVPFGVYKCENVITGGNISWHTKDTKIWLGTSGMKLEVIDLKTEQRLIIGDGRGWVCHDPTGKKLDNNKE